MPTSLITWYYYELAGLGGWLIFFILATIALIWVWYDSLNRNIPAWGWRIGVLVLWSLMLPSIFYRFSVTRLQFDEYIYCITTPGWIAADCVENWNWVDGSVLKVGLPPLTPYYELIFYLGLLGGLLAIATAVAFYVSFKDVTIHDRGRGRTPIPPPPPRPSSHHQPTPRPVEPPPVIPPKRRYPFANAWLVAPGKHPYQLYTVETTIGRSASNDIYLTGDTTISKQHAKITEENNHYRLIDLGSTNGTKVNGHWVRQPILLQPDDEIQFGDNTVVRFITARF